MSRSPSQEVDHVSDASSSHGDHEEKPSVPSTPQRKRNSPPSMKRTPSGNGKTQSEPQLIDHLPRAEEEAMKTFEELRSNHYQYSTLGRSREALESMTCDCQYEHGGDDPWIACGDGSDCINRLTQVECLEDDCRCRSHCQNQRFRRKQYADIEVVQTEKKGFGLRAASNIPKDAFIYEYIGDVVSQPSFAKRMRDYASEGIRHFYFMMLQKDEFIDATKRGGIGRFANHSCAPNCYVAKWTVGKYVRMGIFAKRSIQKSEELTFNYNVDRYGHEAQPCYCGEPNCVGFIGGKTQTDVAAMDDLYLDALGISDEVEMFGLKGSKKKKGKKLDEDYMPILKPLIETDVPKVVQAVRQTQSRKVLVKLLTRIKITEDESALRQLMRLRGFSLMSNILGDFVDDAEIQILVLESISTWPLLQKNKVEDSQIEDPVTACAASENESLRTLAGKLLAHWATLEVGYRIPKRPKAEQQEPVDDLTPAQTPTDRDQDELRPLKRSRFGGLDDEDVPEQLKLLKPLGKTGGPRPTSIPELLQKRQFESKPRVDDVQKSRESVAEIIAAAARAAAEAQQAAADAAAILAKAEEAEKSKGASGSKSKKKLSAEEKEAYKEKKLMKLVGAVVVKVMSKYQKQMDHNVFKKHAKELTQIIADKEKKSQSYISGKLDALSDEKVTKIKKFAKEYIAKVLRKLEKSGKHQHASSSTHTPGASGEPSATNGDANGELNVEDTLDLEDDDVETEDPSPATEAHGPEPDVSVMETDEADTQFMISANATREELDSGWDPSKQVSSLPAPNVWMEL